MARSTRFASSNYLLSLSDTQIELNRMHIQPSQRPSRSFHIDSPWNCLNISCSISHPHIFHDSSSIPPPPPGIPVLLIGRFDPADTPFPKRNIWRALPDPTLNLVDGCVVFLEDFGVVSLRRAHMAIATHFIFNICDETGFAVAQVAYAKGGVPPAAKFSLRGGLTFLYNLFR